MKKQLLTMISILVFGFILASCGSASRGESIASNAAYDAEYAEEANAEYAVDAVIENKMSFGDQILKPTSEDQKLVYSGSIQLETENLDDTTSEIKNLIDTAKGSVSGYESYDYSGRKSIDIEVRIPSEQFFSFFEAAQGAGEESSASYSTQDLTKSYNDNEKRLSSLETEYKTLESLLKDAASVSETLEIQDRLTQVRYEIESLKQNNESIDYDVNYSICRISIQEREKVIQDGDYFGKLGETFRGSFKSILRFFQLLGLFVASAWWVVALIAGIVLVVVKLVKRSDKKRNAGRVEEAKMQEADANKANNANEKP